MTICDRKDCTGCHACYTVCPKSCITMCEDGEGFRYPQIDETICINCGMCQKVCPAVNTAEKRNTITTYAAYSADETEHKTSASGGMAAVFSKNIVKKGGVVFGAKYNADLSVSHDYSCDAEGIKKFKGSKYLQSVVGDAVKELRTSLLDGKRVLFIGTPCQTAGVENLRKTFKNSENLITCDLVCHGTPSYKVMKKYISEIEQKAGKSASEIRFRAPDAMVTLYDEQNVFYKGATQRDAYYIGFIKGLFNRPSCSSCRYACPQRVSDITIGDFWGLGTTTPFEGSKKDGISLCMVNTERGAAFLEECREDLVLYQRETSEAVAGNAQLRAPSVRHKNRDKFFSRFETAGFNRAAKSCLSREMLRYRLIGFLSGSVIKVIRPIYKKIKK